MPEESIAPPSESPAHPECSPVQYPALEFAKQTDAVQVGDAVAEIKLGNAAAVEDNSNEPPDPVHRPTLSHGVGLPHFSQMFRLGPKLVALVALIWFVPRVLAESLSNANPGAVTTARDALAVPSTPDLAATSDTGISASDNITSDTTPTFIGTAESGVSILIFVDVNGNNAFESSSDILVAFGVAASGSYVLTALNPQNAGLLTVKAAASNGSQVSAASGALAVTIDTTAPSAPSIPDLTSSTDSGKSDSDNLTNDSTPTLTGVAEANSRVTVSSSVDGSIGTVTTDVAGGWTLTPSLALSSGTASLIAVATDAAGNISTSSGPLVITIDTSAPAAPRVKSLSDDTGDSASDAITADPTLIFSGSAESLSTVEVFLDTRRLGTVAANSAGAWIYDYSNTPLAPGFYSVFATATDASGNKSPVSTGFSLIVRPTPVITSASTTTGTYTNNFSFTMTATNPPVQFSATGLPAGLQLNPTTGQISGSPMQTGTITVAVGVTNAAGTDASTLTLTIERANASVTLGNLAQTYDGTAKSATVTTNPVGLPVSVTYNGATTAPSNAGSYAVTATINDANYKGTASGTLVIGQANQPIILGNLAQTYDGTAKTATVATNPAGLPATVTYNGATTAPTAAGSYAVQVTIDDDNYSATAIGTLVIAKASQTLTFPAVSAVQVGESITLSASASSGLPVTLSVGSGPAILVGNVLTLNGTGNVVLRAAQAGDANYLPATLERTINSNLLTQTITFDALSDRRANELPFTLSASASSGLPVSFTLVAGPAMLSGSTLTLTGATGTVTVRADQAGSATSAAAAPVTRTFMVAQASPLVFFGSASDGTGFSAEIPENSATGTLVGIIADTGQGYRLVFDLNQTGTISTRSLQLIENSTATASSFRTMAADRPTAEHVAAADLAYTFSGSIKNGVLDFRIMELGITLSGSVEPPYGFTSSIAGAYESTSLNTDSGFTTTMVGTNGRMFILAVTASGVSSGAGTINPFGSFSITTSNAVNIQGNVDASSSTIAGNITLPNGKTERFAGLSTVTLRTDRMINLSTRAYVDSQAGGALVTGFVIGGKTPKRVLLRAIGPTLAEHGITNAVPDPVLTLYNAAGVAIAEVDNWGGSFAAALAMSRVGAFPLDINSLDAVYTAELAPGVYSMRVTNRGAVGITLAEIYDASENPAAETQRLINISSRGRVVGGQGGLVAGFVVTGNSPKRVLIRGIGPSIASFGVPGVLPDPLLKIYNANQQVIASNDNWGTPTPLSTTQRAATKAEIIKANSILGAFPLEAGSADAALIITIAPGLYTVELTATGAVNTGNALVEIYEIPK